jgi:hypothetical protein
VELVFVLNGITAMLGPVLVPLSFTWMSAVVRAAADLTGAPVAHVLRGSRDRSSSTARSVACAALRRMGYSTPLIGALLGGCSDRTMAMDHSSVIAASRRAEKRWPAMVAAVVAGDDGGEVVGAVVGKNGAILRAPAVAA